MKKVILLFSLFYSLSCPLFANDGDSTFNYPVIHTIHINFTQPSFWDSLIQSHVTDTYFMGSIDIDGTALDSVGFKLKGNSSYNSVSGLKKSFKISFDEFTNQKYDGLKTLNLNNSFKDPTMMREKIMLDFLRRIGVPAPRCSYARVYINGNLWGFYAVVEQVNKTFLDDNIGNKDGNLFKGDPHGSLQWKGSTPSLYYSDYELHTNETANDWSDLISFINVINNYSSTQFFDSLNAHLNVAEWIKAWASDILFANLDSYQGSGHNYWIYHNTTSGLFEWIPWDVNEAFGNFQMGNTLSQIKNLSIYYLPNPASGRPLENKMLLNTAFKTMYTDEIFQLMQNDFDTTIIYPMIDSLANAIRTDVYADPNKLFTSANFETNINNDMGNIPGLKSFLFARYNSVRYQLLTLGYTFSGIKDEDVLSNQISIYPNPVSETATISLPENFSSRNMLLEVFNAQGRRIQSENSVSAGMIIFNRKGMSSGIYFIRITSGENIFQTRFVIE